LSEGEGYWAARGAPESALRRKMSQSFVDTDGYTSLELWLYVGGFVLWGVAYVIVVVNIVRKRFVEIPAFAVAANVTWEFVWGWFFTVPMGSLLQWIYRGGWALDAFITYGVWRYGSHQFITPRGRRAFRPAFALALVAWVPAYYFFGVQGYDLPLGSNSAYICNVVDSGLYLALLLTLDDISQFSTGVAWTKMLGTALVTVFVFLKYPDSRFAQTLGVFVFLLDSVYIVMLRQRKAGQRDSSPMTS